MVPLTYTEEQILAYIREGRFDAEIGVRLGLSVGDVQRRIEGICSKYGVRDRAALRAYVEAVPVSADIAANASEPVISPRHSRIRSLGPALLAGTAALGVSAVAVVVLFSSSGTNDESSLYDDVRDLSLVSPVPPTPTLPNCAIR